jgi:hypothetical protein
VRVRLARACVRVRVRVAKMYLQKTQRTMSARGRARGTVASEDPRSAKCPEPSEMYPEPSAWNQRPENQGVRRSQGDCGRELGDIDETGKSKVPNVRHVRESEIRSMPRIAMCQARSDIMKVLFYQTLIARCPQRGYARSRIQC